MAKTAETRVDTDEGSSTPTKLRQIARGKNPGSVASTTQARHLLPIVSSETMQRPCEHPRTRPTFVARVRHRRRQIAWLSTLAVAATGACVTSSGPPPSGGPPDAGLDSQVASTIDARGPDASLTPFTEAAMREAASAFNDKYCEAFARCDGPLFELTFGPTAVSTCASAGGLVAIAASRVRFEGDLAAPYGYGSRLTPDLLRQCAAALDFSSCETWVKFSSERIVPEACTPAFYGTLPLGSPCGAWNQCASGRCVPEADEEGACGVCVEAESVDAPCRACEAGASCRGADGSPTACAKFGDLDALCEPEPPGPWDTPSSPKPCHDYLVCNRSTHHCEPPPANDACDPAAGCSVVPHFRACDPVLKRCVPVPFAKKDALCGEGADTVLGFLSCEPDLTCARLTTESDGASTLVCVPRVEDGAVCTFNPDNDSHCKEPGSVCFRDHCRPNGSAQCTAPEVVP
jgi:hypothetical protein